MKESCSSIVAESSLKICEAEQRQERSWHWCLRRREDSENVQNRTRWAEHDLSKLQSECEQSWMIDWWRIRSTWYVVQLKNEKVKQIVQNWCWWKSLPSRNEIHTILTIYQKQIFDESRRSSWVVEEKQFVEIQILWTFFLRLLQILFSRILHIRNARMFDSDLWRTWRMKECVHWMIQMKCKDNDCTDVRFTMYRIQET